MEKNNIAVIERYGKSNDAISSMMREGINITIYHYLDDSYDMDQEIEDLLPFYDGLLIV